ncbi:MAG: AAA family ATPase, partial [Anaerolineales bacterium]|nr:AAA family ATPase [Anaerolineales bacterium]
NGHVYAPHAVLVERAVDLLDVPPDLIPPALDRLAQDDRVRQEVLPFIETAQQGTPTVGESPGVYGQTAVYLTPLFFGETGVAERLRAMSSAMPTRLSDLPPSFISLGTSLSQEQEDAIRKVLSHPVSVLTGGPGTGKTTCIKVLIDVLETGRKKYKLASPTGRAAKRLSEATGRPASTIHRLLGFKPGEGFKHNPENPLAIDLLVVDEASMLDLLLANNLLKALQPGTHLLLVGDVDQLPSVGAGDVLRDVIASGLVHVTRLSEIFRQAADSQIITNAHRINQGEMPFFPRDRGTGPGSSPGDFFLFPAENPEEAGEWVQDVVCTRIPDKFGLHPRDQIQVLAPMYRGPAGVYALNERLQAAINPPEPRKPEKRLYGQLFRSGDKVMQIQNNYDKDVFNGDFGFVTAIDPIDHTMSINFEGRRVDYDWSETDQLVLAYAVSVHKSQGSEFPAIVLPLVTAHYMMLQRNLLYTAVTRAKELCVLVGNRRAIGIAVKNNKVAHRYTALDWRLSDG